MTRQKQAPIHLAAAEGQVAVLKTLISHGADVRAKDGDGNTALHVAAARTQPGAFAVLLEAGLAIDIPNDHGRVPYDLFQKEGRTEEYLKR